MFRDEQQRRDAAEVILSRVTEDNRISGDGMVLQALASDLYQGAATLPVLDVFTRASEETQRWVLNLLVALFHGAEGVDLWLGAQRLAAATSARDEALQSAPPPPSRPAPPPPNGIPPQVAP